MIDDLKIDDLKIYRYRFKLLLREIRPITTSTSIHIHENGIFQIE